MVARNVSLQNFPELPSFWYYQNSPLTSLPLTPKAESPADNVRNCQNRLGDNPNRFWFVQVLSSGILPPFSTFPFPTTFPHSHHPSSIFNYLTPHTFVLTHHVHPHRRHPSLTHCILPSPTTAFLQPPKNSLTHKNLAQS